MCSKAARALLDIGSEPNHEHVFGFHSILTSSSTASLDHLNTAALALFHLLRFCLSYLLDHAPVQHKAPSTAPSQPASSAYSGSHSCNRTAQSAWGGDGPTAPTIYPPRFAAPSCYRDRLISLWQGSRRLLSTRFAINSSLSRLQSHEAHATMDSSHLDRRQPERHPAMPGTANPHTNAPVHPRRFDGQSPRVLCPPPLSITDKDDRIMGRSLITAFIIVPL